LFSNKSPQPLKVTESPKVPKSLLEAITNSLEDDKAIDISVIELEGKSLIADQMVVASGSSARHVGAIADHLLNRLKEDGFGKQQIEGMPRADWVLIDAKDVIVHLFRPEVRAYYNLEKMWMADIGQED
jgi:ribosome-associated protein